MAVAMTENRMLILALRALQLICAIVVMGTDGYGIHMYRGYSSYVDTSFGGFYSYFGVPNAWGFLMFCAGWTTLVVIFQLIAGDAFPDRVLFGYIRVAAEMVALLSWFAGWIAVAVNIGTGSCFTGYIACGALKAATVFGAFEWLLFIGSATITISLFLNSKRRPRTSTS